MGRIAPDSNDLFVLMFNEPSGSTTNTNTGSIDSSGNFTTYGDAILGYQGLFDNALYIPEIANVTTKQNGSGGANTVSLGNSFSLSGWIFLRKKSNNFEQLFMKQFFDGVWSSPFISAGIQMLNSTDGSWQAFVTFGSTLNSITVTAVNGNIPVGRWSHVGMTFDGSTLRAYLNGTLVQSGNLSGTVNYNLIGTPGKWFVGCPSASNLSSGAGQSIIYQDIRFANVVRPQTYFAEIFYNRFIK